MKRTFILAALVATALACGGAPTGYSAAAVRTWTAPDGKAWFQDDLGRVTVQDPSSGGTWFG